MDLPQAKPGKAPDERVYDCRTVLVNKTHMALKGVVETGSARRPSGEREAAKAHASHRAGFRRVHQVVNDERALAEGARFSFR